LYALYYTQTGEKKKINIDLKSFEKLIDLYDTSVKEGPADISVIIRKMFQEEAFSYGKMNISL
jgi:Small nuclear RNA activating complex (SNAPc), subunit SNAP43.